MNLDVTLFNLSTQPLLYIWNLLSRRVKIHPSKKYNEILSNFVMSSDQPQPLFVSIGSGDFVSSWLTRLYHEYSITGENKPKINKLVIKRLTYSQIDMYEQIGILQPGFRVAAESNIQILQNDPLLKREGVTVEEREWKSLPPFHGYLYGDRLLIGPWMVNEAGQLHVKTPLWETNQRNFAGRHAMIRELFEVP